MTQKIGKEHDMETESMTSVFIDLRKKQNTSSDISFSELIIVIFQIVFFHIIFTI